MGFTEHAPHNWDDLLERRDGLVHFIASGIVRLEQGLSAHRAHLECNIVFGSQLLPSNRYYLAQNRLRFANLPP